MRCAGMRHPARWQDTACEDAQAVWYKACYDIAYWAGAYAPTHSLRVALWYLF
jgi:hypothetical protein